MGLGLRLLRLRISALRLLAGVECGASTTLLHFRASQSPRSGAKA